MNCHNCNSEIADGSKFCIQCGFATVSDGINEPEKPNINSPQLTNSIMTSKLFAGAVVLASLMIQTIGYVKFPIPSDLLLFVFFIACAVISAVFTLVFYIKNRAYKFRWIIYSSLIAFIISPIPLWMLLIILSRPDYGRLAAIVMGWLIILLYVALNMLCFYLVIMVGFFGYTMIKKRGKTNV